MQIGSIIMKDKGIEMKNFIKTVFLLSAFLSVNLLQARPQYLAVFKTYIKDLPQGSLSTANCFSCHIKGEPRASYSVFMEDFFGELGEKNLKDKDQILESLVEALELPSEVDNKTYKELILDGLVPNTIP